MKIEYIDRPNSIRDSSVIALGNFDGCHLGHLEIFEKTKGLAEYMQCDSSVMLFTNHTKNTLESNNFKVLSTFEEKIKILEDLHFDKVFAVNLDESFMKMPKEKFLKDFLIDKLRVKGIVVGKDYRFAYKKEGDLDFLIRMQSVYNYKLEVADDVLNEGKKISSSQIREDLVNGKLEQVNKLIYGNYTLRGKVVAGFKRGRKLGFPTANIEFDKRKLLPSEGVYFTLIKIDGIKYCSMTSVGKNTTFGLEDIRIEVNILDFGQEIYGKEVDLEFIKFLRPMIKFSSANELIEQMNKDKELAKDIKNIYKF